MPNTNNVNNFVPKVWDRVAQEWRPLYIPPDATAFVQGMVFLSDGISEDYDADTGMTAVTPKALSGAIDSMKAYTDSKVSDIDVDGVVKATVNTSNQYVIDKPIRVIDGGITFYDGTTINSVTELTQNILSDANDAINTAINTTISTNIDTKIANVKDVTQSADGTMPTVNATYSDTTKTRTRSLPLATTTTSGLMSPADKQRLATVVTQDDLAEFTSGVSGVKGNAEAAYRTGAVNITYENIGTVQAANIGAGAVTSGAIAANAVTSNAIATNAVTSTKISSSAVTMAKLGSDVSVLQVSSTEPTDSHVMFWIKP